MEKNSCGTREEKVKKRKRHNKHTLGEAGDMTVHKNKFGFVEIENPVYYNNSYNYSPPQFLMRKATPEERREMVVNYIIRRNGKPISLDNLADKLAVSKRTIQLLMKSLKDEGLIDVQPTFDKQGKQRHNSYRYIGPHVEKFGSGLTIGMLYDVKNRAGFRDWDWEEYSYKNKGYFDLQDLYISKSQRRKVRGRYLRHFKKDESACIIVQMLLATDARARRANRRFYRALAGREREVQNICGKPYAYSDKNIRPETMEKNLPKYHNKIDEKNIQVIEEIRADYKRRQGNLVLRLAKFIKPEYYENTRKRKANDNKLKRSLGISRRNTGRAIKKFLSSFGQECEYIERDFYHRLQEIEEEMEQERKKQDAASSGNGETK